MKNLREIRDQTNELIVVAFICLFMSALAVSISIYAATKEKPVVPKHPYDEIEMDNAREKNNR